MASTVALSHLPLGVPLNEPSLPRAAWISEIRPEVGAFCPRTRRIDFLEDFPWRFLIPRFSADDLEDFAVCAAATAPVTHIPVARSSVRARRSAFRIRISVTQGEGDASVSPQAYCCGFSAAGTTPDRNNVKMRSLSIRRKTLKTTLSPGFSFLTAAR